MNTGHPMLPAVAAAMLLSAFASPAFASSYAQQKLRSKQFPVHTVCMMPPEGHLTRLGMKGAEAIPDESETFASALGTFVASHLKSAGIVVVSALAAQSTSASNDELRQVLAQIQEKYHAISKLLDKKPKEIGKSAFTLGDEVALLPCAANSDLIVFVQGTGYTLTEGRVGAGLLGAGPYQPFARLTVTMADARTGEILAFLRLSQLDPSLQDPEDGILLDNDLSDINLGSARKNAIARDRDGVYR